jgi:5'-AMP-activated protein kinase catalytic alpha subunit
MENGPTLMKRYKIGRLIGHGSLDTKLYYARNLEGGKYVTIKVFDKDKASRVMVQITREVAAMRLLRHPNILKLFEVMASKSKIYFVLEYAQGGELFSKIAREGMLVRMLQEDTFIN